MTVNIETGWGYRSTAEMDGNTFIMSERPDTSGWYEVRVWGEGVRKYYSNPTVMEVPSTDGKFHFKLLNPIPQAERIKNIEDALVELYELLEV